MSTLYLRLGAILCALAGLTACGDNQDDGGARALLRSVQAESYREWQRAPGFDTRKSSSAPHGGAVDIYVNDVVAELLASGKPAEHWPVGALIAKDGYDGSKLELIALMQKREDGWYWAEYDEDGDPIYSGRPDLCIDCHSRGSDHVRAFGLP